MLGGFKHSSLECHQDTALNTHLIIALGRCLTVSLVKTAHVLVYVGVGYKINDIIGELLFARCVWFVWLVVLGMLKHQRVT